MFSSMMNNALLAKPVSFDGVGRFAVVPYRFCDFWLQWILFSGTKVKGTDRNADHTWVFPFLF